MQVQIPQTDQHVKLDGQTGGLQINRVVSLHRFSYGIRLKLLFKIYEAHRIVKHLPH